MKYLIQIIIIQYLWPKFCDATIDINAEQLQYLADHLTPEECRRLVASAHFQSFDEPNALDKAERKVPKDIQCIEHLHHWNSQAGEGKGQTHELLGRRLRQMGRTELADWLGKTVFHHLGVDLQKDIEEGITDLQTESESTEFDRVTIEPLVPKIEDPTRFGMVDYFLYSLALGLALTIVALCLKLVWSSIAEGLRKRRLKKSKMYDFIDTDSSGSEHEENKFDVRTYASSSYVTR